MRGLFNTLRNGPIFRAQEAKRELAEDDVGAATTAVKASSLSASMGTASEMGAKQAKREKKFAPSGELTKVHLYQPFNQLSSLSTNCTNDFFVASGFTHDLAVYDMQRNFPIKTVQSAHQHFINISRFSASHPHLM